MTAILTRTIADWDKAQLNFPDAKVELVGGEIIIMAPSGMESEEVSSRFLIKLGAWVDEKNLGRTLGSSAIFDLPNGDRRVPDVSFIKAENLAQAPKQPAEVVPDLIVEVKSPSDSLQKLREKIASFLTQGSLVGILVDPDTKKVEVFRLNLEPEILMDGDTLTIPELFPDWSLSITSLWARNFSDQFPHPNQPNQA